jgi:hypothetical protein
MRKYSENIYDTRKPLKIKRLLIYAFIFELFLYIFGLLVIILINQHSDPISEALATLQMPGMYIGRIFRSTIG